MRQILSGRISKTTHRIIQFVFIFLLCFGVIYTIKNAFREYGNAYSALEDLRKIQQDNIRIKAELIEIDKTMQASCSNAKDFDPKNPASQTTINFCIGRLRSAYFFASGTAVPDLTNHVYQWEDTLDAMVFSNLNSFALDYSIRKASISNRNFNYKQYLGKPPQAYMEYLRKELDRTRNLLNVYDPIKDAVVKKEAQRQGQRTTQEQNTRDSR
ncbi:hypothetical protein [Chroococcidiopsis sp.]|uniref:hypothetical protein n=1 Tax=Chroococcidiopsis sp. TaxID=3088168 RepID=UPI003F3928B9